MDEARLRRRDDVAVELGAGELAVVQVDVALAVAVDVAVAGVDEEELGIVAALDVARHLGVVAGEPVEDGGALGHLGAAGGVGVQPRGLGVEDHEQRRLLGEEREQLPGLDAVVVGELERLDAGIEAAVLRDDHRVGARARRAPPTPPDQRRAQSRPRASLILMARRRLEQAASVARRCAASGSVSILTGGDPAGHALGGGLNLGRRTGVSENSA